VPSRDAFGGEEDPEKVGIGRALGRKSSRRQLSLLTIGLRRFRSSGDVEAGERLAVEGITGPAADDAPPVTTRAAVWRTRSPRGQLSVSAETFSFASSNPDGGDGMTAARVTWRLMPVASTSSSLRDPGESAAVSTARTPEPHVPVLLLQA
jgi:hypothetical protein